MNSGNRYYIRFGYIPKDEQTIQSLLVHESVRQQGRGNVMLMFAEEKAKKLGLKQVVLCARKGTFLIP